TAVGAVALLTRFADYLALTGGALNRLAPKGDNGSVHKCPLNMRSGSQSSGPTAVVPYVPMSVCPLGNLGSKPPRISNYGCSWSAVGESAGFSVTKTRQ